MGVGRLRRALHTFAADIYEPNIADAAGSLCLSICRIVEHTRIVGEEIAHCADAFLIVGVPNLVVAAGDAAAVEPERASAVAVQFDWVITRPSRASQTGRVIGGVVPEIALAA